LKYKLYILIFLAAIGSLMQSCKPRLSLSGATIPPEAKTISVALFANNTTLGPPTLSQRFSEKMRDVVSQQTNLALIKNNADLQFDGFISDYNVAPVAIQSTDQAGLNRLTISVSVKYTNKFDEKQSFDQVFTRFADFKATESINAKEADLVLEINRQLTEDIFNRAFNNW
jgi:hypothetical protein